MATVLPPRQPMFNVGVNLDLTSRKRKEEEWYREAMRMLREKEESEERGYFDRLEGQETNYRTIPGGMMPMADETGAFVETLMPDQREAYQTPVYERQKLDTPEKINQYRDEMRAKLQALGVQKLGERPDPYTLIPRYGKEPQKGLTFEQRKQLKEMSYTPQLWFDKENNVYDAKTAEGRKGIARAAKEKLDPRRPATEQEARMLENMYRSRFFLEEPVAEEVEKKRLEQVTTPKERRKIKLKPYIDMLSKYGSGTKKDNAIIQEGIRKLNRANEGAWGDIVKKYRDKLLTSKVKLPKPTRRGQEATEDDYTAYREIYETHEETIKALKKAGFK